MYLDVKYLFTHIVVNIICVDIWNITLEQTFCNNSLLACCDPLNWSGSFTFALKPNGWLLGHLLAYAFAGYMYGKVSIVAHANLLLCQITWFFFEYATFLHTYELEKLLHYQNGTHPCPHRSYFSTWIPIWQDFPYNSLGQLFGCLLFKYGVRIKACIKAFIDTCIKSVISSHPWLELETHRAQSYKV